MASVRWILASAIAMGLGTPAMACLKDNTDGQAVEGKLSVQNARDAAGRREKPYILTLTQPVCLDAIDAEDNVKSTTTVHVYSTNAKVQAALAKVVGGAIAVRGKPFAAHTAHHHAPIVLDVSEIVIK
jgi:hypothetical protein